MINKNGMALQLKSIIIQNICGQLGLWANKSRLENRRAVGIGKSVIKQQCRSLETAFQP